MRVGLTFTPWTISSESVRSVAATTNGAAEEKSPGMSMLSGGRLSTGQTETAWPERLTFTPSIRRSRSV